MTVHGQLIAIKYILYHVLNIKKDKVGWKQGSVSSFK